VSSGEHADRPLLLDASVWLAALDRDDPHHGSAQRLLEATASGTIELAALDLTLFEVANVAVVRWHSQEDAERLVTLVTVACPTTLRRADEALLRAAVQIAAQHDLTVYDGAYVAAAAQQRWTLVSGDLRNLVAPRLAVAPDAAVSLVA
jgi:predicted nucleic acid-binding protein